MSSGTAALEIILRGLKINGGEVIVPTNTFAATAFSVLHAGGIPVFADCGQDLCVDPEEVAKRITRNTKAIITVHIGGLVSPSTHELVSLCRRKSLPLIEDAAHAHGSALKGQQAGTFGVAGAFSFFATKVMTTGEGGMIVTDDRGMYEQALVLRDQAKVRGMNLHETLGHNWRLTEMQALLGLAQLRRLDEFIARRQHIAAIYDTAFSGLPGLMPLHVPPDVRHNFYKYVLLLERPGNILELESRLRQEFGVAMGGRVYDLPCHAQPVFRPFNSAPLPVAEDLCRRHLCPPIYPLLTDEEAHYVAQSMICCVRET